MPKAELDLSNCPYYRYWHEGGEPRFCESGCHSEPSCITDEPSEGWPSKRKAKETDRG